MTDQELVACAEHMYFIAAGVDAPPELGEFILLEGKMVREWRGGLGELQSTQVIASLVAMFLLVEKS